MDAAFAEKVVPAGRSDIEIEKCFNWINGEDLPKVEVE